MSDYNLFVLVPKLLFDVPENDSTEHTKAAKAIKTRARELGASEGDPATRSNNMAKKTFLEEFFKDVQAGTLNAEKYENARKEKLDAVKLAFENSRKSAKKEAITEQYIKTCSKNTGLSEDSVKEILRKLDFEFVNFDLKQPEFTKKRDIIEENLAFLRRLGAENSQHEALRKMNDVYDVVAYLKGNIDDANDFRNMLYDAGVKNFLEDWARANSMKNDDITKHCRQIVSPAINTIFSSKEAKDDYDNYLKYNTLEMSSLISQIKSLPESSLRQPDVADDFIMKIERVFNNKDYALAIFNHSAGFMKKDSFPYIPQTVKFYVKCGHCGTDLPFGTEAERNNAQVCKSGNLGCGKPLYRQCRKPGCKKMVLVALSKCPVCETGFNSAAEFAKHMAKADEARRNCDFEDARQHLVRAKTADPGETTRTTELERAINSDEERYKKPINDLRILTTAKEYQAASTILVQIISEFPMLNVRSFESDIKAALLKAKSDFDVAKTRNPSECANMCLDILEECADYKPATDFLTNNPPLPAKNFKVAEDKKNCRVSINWERTGEKGVTYYLVRKIGKNAPTNKSDCDAVLLENSSETAFRDDKLPPGTWCSYGVFSSRKGAFSSAASTSVLLLAEVTDVRHELSGTNVRITWNLPRNCTGVKITRIHNGMETLLSDNAQTSYEDKGLEYGVRYEYKLKANYTGHPSSVGENLTVTIVPSVDSFSINAKQLKKNKYHVSWEIPQRNIDLRILLNKKVFRELKSDSGGYEVEFPINGHHVLEVAAYSAGNWINSLNSVEITTYPPLETDKAKTMLIEKPIPSSTGGYKIELSIVLSGEIPGNVVGLYYAIRTKGAYSQQAPWVTANEIGSSSDIKRVDINKYRYDDKITSNVTAKGEETFYLTIFTIYTVNDKEIISDPHKRRIDRPILANVLWKVSKSVFGKARLFIEVKPNRKVCIIPRLVLCASDGKVLSLDDAKAEHILDIPETELDNPVISYKQDYELPNGIQKNIRLFLFSDPSSANEKYVTKWASGFQGKLAVTGL